MKSWILVPLVVAVALPTHILTRELLAAPATEVGHRSTDLATPELRARIERLTQESRALGTRLAGLQETPAPTVRERNVEPEEIARAVDAWLAEHGLGRDDLAAPAAPDAARVDVLDDELASRVSQLSIDELLAVMLTTGGFDGNSDLIFEELRRSGRMQDYVAALEARVEASPQEAGLRVALGMAYLQQLFGMSASPEAGQVATQADQAFDAALELDGTNWAARFMKAVALSNWPAFLGRTNEAIGHFEILVEQQEGAPVQDSFAETWLYLGNMYDQTGRRDEALDAWRRGLERFPEHAALRERLELAEASGD